MTGTSVLAQFRTWLRANCPLIDKNDKFNANYIGATATEYTIRTAGDPHRDDITGKDSPTYNLTFEARLINQADAGTARYQLQISLEMEEL